MASNTASSTAATEYGKMHGGKEPQPAPPVQAARLSQLLKSLANAESSVSEVIKSRRALIDGLEKLLATNRSELAKEEALAAQLTEQKSQTDTKKREVEEAIMQTMAADDHSGDNSFGDGEVPRPEVEELTPPPVEGFTPPGSPKPEQPQQKSTTHGPFTEEADEPIPQTFEIHDSAQPDNGVVHPEQSSNLQAAANDFDGAKRRKMVHPEEGHNNDPDSDDYAPFADAALDPEVAAMIAQGNQ